MILRQKEEPVIRQSHKCENMKGISMKQMRHPHTQHSDQDGLTSRIAADIWNHLIQSPRYHLFSLSDYAHILEAVNQAVRPRERKKLCD